MNRNSGRGYIRDGRAPIPASESTSHVMRANKAKNTGPELQMRAALRQIGLGGYRLHWRKAPGTPDIAYPSAKIAVFINGCFWHRCPICMPPLPKSHTQFWQEKFERNVRRDKEKKEKLESEGWHVFVLWECEIEKSPQQCANRVKSILMSASSHYAS